jgi:hypothetical protein
LDSGKLFADLKFFHSFDSGKTWLMVENIILDSLNSSISVNDLKISHENFFTIGYDCFQKEEDTPLIYIANKIVKDTVHFCDGDDLTLSTDKANSNIRWSLNGEFHWENTESIKVLEEGRYGIHVTNKNGCTFKNEIFIIKHEKPDSDFDITPNPQVTLFCTGAELVFTPSDSLLKNTWILDDTVISTNELRYTFHSSGSNTIKMISNEKHCISDTIIKKIEILNDPVASFSLSENKYCFGDTIQAINQSSFSGDSIERSFESVWKFNKNSFDESNNLSTQMIANENGILSLQIIPKDSSLACSATIEESIIVNPRPDIDFNIYSNDSVAFSFCRGESGNLIDELNYFDSVGYNYSWLINGVSKSGIDNNIYFENEGNFNVQLNVESLNSNCTNSLEKQFVVFPVPEGTFEINELLF